MWCPNCKAEYKEGIDTCPECGAKLVERLIEPSHEAPDMVSVLETSDAGTLPVIKSVLDAADIPYFVQGDESFGILPAGGTSGFFGDQGLGVAILVPVDRADEARELLAADARIDDDDLNE